MLRFEKLVIQGFKSFKRKVSIPFPAGFSCITGPNGSGKTNVLDAVCFVLGRSRSSSLRAKTGKELVFHGSKTKPGADFASVVLYLDNSGRDLPLEEKTVTIGRRINKGGVSTYRLNGKVVTRQQILDIFAQAGIHPDGHNIIQQGDVNQVVEMDPVERRGILDDISGIAEYDDKKNKAMKELEKIEAKVKEAEIILEQKSQVMERLQNDRDTALKYQTLQKKLENIRAALMWLEQNKSEQGIGDINKKLKGKKKEFDSLGKELDGHDKRIGELEKKLDEMLKSSLDIKGQLDIAKKISRLESEIEFKENQLEANKGELERLKAASQRVTSLQGKQSPAMQKVLGMNGVQGTVSDLIKVPTQFATAVEVAAGSRINDIVVDTLNTAVACVKYLKKNKLGRLRFLPMDKVRPQARSRFLPKEAVDWLSSLIKFDQKYGDVMDYIFGSTACVRDIDTAKAIARSQRIRMVTLDGDLFEASGAVTGGYYQKKQQSESNLYLDEVKRVEAESQSLEKEILALKKEFDMYKSQEKKTDKVFSVQKNQAKVDVELEKLRDARKGVYERRIVLQAEIGNLSVERAKLEARFDNIKGQMEGDGELPKFEELKSFIEFGPDALKMKQKRTITAIQELGPVNMKALQDFDELQTEFEDFKEKVGKIVEERKSILDTIVKIESRRLETFNKTLVVVSGNFMKIYKDLTGGDAELGLEVESDINSGLMIKANPVGKKLLHIDSMSGGEKTITAFAFLFAIQKHKPAPFYILDEADATLDKTNTKKVVDLIRKQSKDAQFIVISHNDTLVRGADQVYGVAMEDGESKVFGVKLPENN